MAFLINNQTVIDNNRNLANIATFDSTVTSSWDVVTSTATSKTLVNREYCTVTAAGQTITLPASPSAGWQVVIVVGNFNDTIINPGIGIRIMGQALGETMTLDRAYAALNFLYVDATQGWRIF